MQEEHRFAKDVCGSTPLALASFSIGARCLDAACFGEVVNMYFKMDGPVFVFHHLMWIWTRHVLAKCEHVLQDGWAVFVSHHLIWTL